MKKLIAVLCMLAVVAPVFAEQRVSTQRRYKGKKIKKLETINADKLLGEFKKIEPCYGGAMERRIPAEQLRELLPVSDHVARAIEKQEGSLGKDVKILKEILKVFDAFKKGAYTHQYYEYDVMFQLLDNLRVSYMEQRGESRRAGRVAAKKIYFSVIEIANGDRQITIGDYIRMEVVNLMPTEQEKFKAFLQALEEDIKR